MGVKRYANLTGKDLIAQAEDYYDTGSSSGKETLRRVILCIDLLRWRTKPVHELGPVEAASLLSKLKAKGYGPSTVTAYYAALKASLKLVGISPVGWPSPPKKKRGHGREPIPNELFPKAIAWLREQGQGETADLAILIRNTGLRPRVEALKPGNKRIKEGKEYDVLRVTGKGGHSRDIPVLDPETREILKGPRLKAIHSRSYERHNEWWKRAITAVGVDTRLPTLHALRHSFITEIVAKLGDPALAQQLAGHADLATTMVYVGDRDITRAAERLASLL